MYDLKRELLVLTEGGGSDYTIVHGKDASESVRHAATELQSFLRQISGAELPIRDDTAAFEVKSVLLGDNLHTRSLKPDGLPAGLGDEGFVLETSGETLMILGSDVRGVIYGVYTLLEDYFGCRWLTTEVSHIPQKNRLTLPQLCDRQVPALEYRDVYHSFYLSDANWHVRNKCNGNQPPLGPEHGGKMSYCKYFVHSFDNLVPVDEYFDAHPEYFSEVNGVRMREKTQLCLSNPDVLRICIDRIREWIREYPDSRIVTVSVNDCFNPCQCAQCEAVFAEEESHAGVLVQFINKIAEIITAEYPHILIDTLSYLYTRKAPKNLRTHPNVIVRVCTIECCFAHPLDRCEAMGSFNLEESARPNFAQDLIAWGKRSDRMYIWDYTTNFENYLQPCPNFKVLKPNIKFYIDNGVKGVFIEGCTTPSPSRSGELDELRLYLLAKLLWNPDLDPDAVINDFMAAYYKSAAPAMRAYFDLLHTQIENPEYHAGVYDAPTRPYLNNAMLENADVIFDKAERLADDETVLERVQRARLSITHSILAKQPVATPMRTERVNELFDKIASHGIHYVTEHFPLAESQERMLAGRIHLHNQ